MHWTLPNGRSVYNTFVVVVVDNGDADSDSVTLTGSISMSLGKLGLVDWFLTFGCVTAS